jgi:superfamily II DNA or RNA helicase
MISLRSYQEQGIGEIRMLFKGGVRRVCFVSPTASGKRQ